jgi:hypothetical protein
MASLIETCKLNAVDPYAYLRETLTAIAKGHPASRIAHRASTTLCLGLSRSCQAESLTGFSHRLQPNA